MKLTDVFKDFPIKIVDKPAKETVDLVIDKPFERQLKIKYYENGNLQAMGHFKNDQLDGEILLWCSNGQLSVHCHYLDGKLDGEYKIWDEEGKLISWQCFKDGEVIKDCLE